MYRVSRPIGATPNPDSVPVCPYDSIVTGTGDWGGSGALTSREFLWEGNKYRVRQAGVVTSAQLYCALKAHLTGAYLKFWRRRTTGLYDLVAASGNLASQLAAGQTCTVTLTPGLTVQVGDYYGFRLEWDGTGEYNLKKNTGATYVDVYLVDNQTPAPTGYNWEGQTKYANSVVPIISRETAPVVVGLGDSIMAGHGFNYSFCEASATAEPVDPAHPFVARLARKWGDLPYQNMGIGSQTSTQIAARLSADCLALKPQLVILEGGVNDLIGGGTYSTYLANWTAMLEACRDAAGVSVVALAILPWTNGTTAQMTARDQWNAGLRSLVTGYANAVYLDLGAHVGRFRSGGPVGNTWDIDPVYDYGDGIHYNLLGHQRLADVIDAILGNAGTKTLFRLAA